MKSLYEELANVEHQCWVDWQKYLHSKCVKVVDVDDKTGKEKLKSVEIPVELFKRWERQIKTPYSELSEREKERNREQVDRYAPLIIERIKSIQSSDNKGALEFLKAIIIRMFKR